VFVVLLLALLLMKDMTWKRCLQAACNFFAEKRELERRSRQLEIRRGKARDLIAEIQTTVMNYWLQIPARELSNLVELWVSKGAAWRLSSARRTLESMASVVDHDEDDDVAPAALPDFDAPLEDDEHDVVAPAALPDFDAPLEDDNSDDAVPAKPHVVLRPSSKSQLQPSPTTRPASSSVVSELLAFARSSVGEGDEVSVATVASVASVPAAPPARPSSSPSAASGASVSQLVIEPRPKKRPRFPTARVGWHCAS